MEEEKKKKKMKTTVADPTDLALQDIVVRLSPAVRISPADLRAAVADLMDLALQGVFVRLCPADLLRAALACKTWRNAAVRALPHVPPLRGYFFHPKDMQHFDVGGLLHHPSVFRPINDASSSAERLSLNLTPAHTSRFHIEDVHLGLVLLFPPSWGAVFPPLLVVDPASRRRVELPPPPPPTHDALADCDGWSRRFIGAAVLARAHPSRLTFDAVCLTVQNDRPRAWVASVLDGRLDSWRAWPKSMGVVLDFDYEWLEPRGVHAAGNIYWHINNSNRVLQLDPCTMDFSFLTVPDDVGDGLFGVTKYRIGETPEDGRLCVVSIAADQTLQIWVRGGEPRWSDNGWYLQREPMLSRMFDAVPGLPKDSFMRMDFITLLDIACTGAVFILTPGGRYTFHLKTGRLEHSGLNGHPIFAYTLPWPPQFLADTPNRLSG